MDHVASSTPWDRECWEHMEWPVSTAYVPSAAWPMIPGRLDLSGPRLVIAHPLAGPAPWALYSRHVEADVFQRGDHVGTALDRAVLDACTR